MKWVNWKRKEGIERSKDLDRFEWEERIGMKGEVWEWLEMEVGLFWQYF